MYKWFRRICGLGKYRITSVLKVETDIIASIEASLTGRTVILVIMYVEIFTELILIHKNIRSVRNSHAQELTLILKIIGQCDVKHILTSQIKTIMPILKISTYIITSITGRPVRLSSILAIMFVSTFKTDIIPIL
jgi:hypothetical protein